MKESNPFMRGHTGTNNRGDIITIEKIFDILRACMLNLLALEHLHLIYAKPAISHFTSLS